MAPRRTHSAARGLAAALLLLPLLCGRPPAWGALPETTADDSPSYEQRASAEKTSRSRYRKLEIASAILIIGCGGAVILWAVRRK